MKSRTSVAPAPKTKISWSLISGTPDYKSENGWKAVYWKTVKGFGCYKTYRPDGTQYGIGGLFDFV